jgi:hypothetical protein
MPAFRCTSRQPIDPHFELVLHLLVIVLLFRLRKMPSHQEPAPGSKSSKFVAANPLDPMLNPFVSSFIVFRDSPISVGVCLSGFRIERSPFSLL